MSCRIRSASSSRTKLFGNNRNFSNVRLHEGLDQANAYAGYTLSNAGWLKHTSRFRSLKTMS